MKIIDNIQDVRAEINTALRQNKTIGFVPTMGALHIGHESLMQAAAKQCDYVVVSIFVNPTQFEPGSDYQSYPRDLQTDAEICRKNKVDLIFAPTTEQMYPQKQITWVSVEQLTETLCGQYRPGHFRGVCTVCTKLFNIIGPHKAFFGQKDAQQAIIIKKMVADLNMPLQIEICPTVRQPDGLAVSSRNKYLNADQRKQAPKIYEALSNCSTAVKRGLKEPEKLIQKMAHTLSTAPDIKPEYIEIVDTETLEPAEWIDKPVLVAIAAKLGPARLIDNIIIDPRQ